MTETITTTFGALCDNFSGRSNMADYNPNKLYTIHVRNRAYVWKLPKVLKFLDSIRKGYYIPPIIVHEHIENGHIIRRIMDGGNRMTTARFLDTNTFPGCPVTEEDRAALRNTPVSVVILRNMTSEAQRDMFRRINNPTTATSGQLFDMSAESALVEEAIALIRDPNYTHRARIDAHFPMVTRADGDGRRILANAVAIVAGAVHGVSHITTSFDIQEDVLTTPIFRQTYIHIIGHALDVFDAADARFPDFDRRSLTAMWSVGNILGAMIYEFHTTDDIAAAKTKWASYIVRVRSGDALSAEVMAIGGANNLTPTRHKRICFRVGVYLTENRLPSIDETKEVKHIGDVADEESLDTEE